MLGLFAFFYGTVHFLIFIVADRLASLGFPSLAAWQTWTALTASIGEEILKRPYITVGFTSWVCMLALALTSTARDDPPARRQAVAAAAPGSSTSRRWRASFTSGGW